MLESRRAGFWAAVGARLQSVGRRGGGALAVALGALAPALAWAAGTVPELRGVKHGKVVYQIYPKSFADSDGDGTGDLPGITAKVDYLSELGVDVVWLNPIFKSPQVDGGYDVSDYLAVDPMFGTLAELHALRDALHARGMKLVLDMVINHSSDLHPWFLQEVRYKALQTVMTKLLRAAPPEERADVLAALHGGQGGVHARANAVREAKAARDLFLKEDGAEARNAGYPDQKTQLSALEALLRPCAFDPGSCPKVAQPETDFYLWRERPNNWIGVFNASAWRYLAQVDAYFLSLFSEHQADLNWRNPRVREAMGRVVATWRTRGVDGMRLDAVSLIAKHPDFPDAPAHAPLRDRGHEFYANQPEVHAYLRELLHNAGPNFISIGEVTFNRGNAPAAYAGTGTGIFDEIFVFDHMDVDCAGSKWHAKPFVLTDFKRRLGGIQRQIHGRAWVGNYFENHDWMRSVSRWGDVARFRRESATVLATLLLTLEGTPYIYQGQEIGMTDLDPSTFKTIADVDDVEGRNFFYAAVQRGEPAEQALFEVASRSRDNVRSAMQWDASAHAGFSTAVPKIAVNHNYPTINVASDRADPMGVWRHYQRLIALHRAHPSWVEGKFIDHLPKHPAVYVYTRELARERTLVALNFSSEPQAVTLPPAARLGEGAQLVLGNWALGGPGPAPAPADRLELRPWEAQVYVGPGPEGPTGQVHAGWLELGRMRRKSSSAEGHPKG